MDKRLKTRQDKRKRRQISIRTRVQGSTERPRLNVHRSLLNIYAQIIDDTKNQTLAGVHSKTVDKKGEVGERKGKSALAYLVGKSLAEKAKVAGITKVVFDRGGYRYGGRIQALADGAREGGLEF